MSPQARHAAGIAIFIAGLGIAVLAALLALGVWQLPILRPADVQGDWFSEDFSSHWQAWLRHGEVVQIRELATGADRGNGNQLEYLFTDGRLTSLRWPGRAPVTDLLALAAVAPHAQALVRQARLRSHLPAPDLQCDGNEPFWSLHLNDTQVAYHWSGAKAQATLQQRSYQGSWKYLPGSLEAPAIEWLGRAEDAQLAILHMRITPGLCLDSTVGIKQFGPFTSRVSLILGKTLYSGCCRPASVIP